MKLSVIILNYNVRYFLELCLKSVRAATAGLSAEIIVVDNNSSDGSCTMLKQLFPEIRLIENRVNLGFSRGNNIGAAQAKGDYLCILNPDTVVAEDTFAKVLEYADTLPQMGVLGCQLVDGRGRFLPESKRNIPTPKVSLKKALGFTKAYYAHKIDPEAIGGVEVLVGAFMLVKKDVYQNVGGFDEDYFMYGEDIDLSYKILKAGYQNVYYGKTAIIHYKGESTVKDKVYARHFYGAMHIFYDKHFKTNRMIDVLVKLGIRLSGFYLKKYQGPPPKTKTCVLLTNNSDFKIDLPFQVRPFRNLASLPPNTILLFDGNSLSYKEIIKKMKTFGKGNDLMFRVLPKDSYFVIGSDSSEFRGEVILLLGFGYNTVNGILKI